MTTTNAEAWKTVTAYKDELNTNGRKIAFGGAAFAWTLQIKGVFPSLIGMSLIFFVLFFINDLVQLFVGYYLRREYLIDREKELRDKVETSLSGDYTFNQDIDVLPYRLAIFKWILLSVAFSLLLWHLWSIVNPLGSLLQLLPVSGSTPQSP